MLRRAAGQNIPDSEFDLEFYNGCDADDATSDGEESSYLSSDFEHRIPWRMGNEGPGLESTDEEEDEPPKEWASGRGRGKAFTMAEFRKMAKFMATFSSAEWNAMHRKDRWEPLLEKVWFMFRLAVRFVVYVLRTWSFCAFCAVIRYLDALRHLS